ncbi:MAG: ATP-binding protein [Thiohalobacteraceae bacterium]
MHSLFWKIFVSFWAALALFALATILAANLFLEHQREQQGEVSPRVQLRQAVDAARAAAATGGVEGLKNWLRRYDRQELVPLLVIDVEGHELLGRSVPEYVQDRLQRSLVAGEGRDRRARDVTLIRTPDGARYRLVPDFTGVTLQRLLVRPRVLALPVLVAALVSGLVCFLLARYLTLPLRRLRDAAGEYAQGNLALRVAPGLGDRRDEIADLAHDFDRMAEQLTALLHSHKRLLGDVSHELRSPLARLQVALELARTRSDATVHKELDRIALEAERLNEMIGQLLALARLEAQDHPSGRESVDMRALLQGVVDDARFEAVDQSRRIELHAPDALYVYGDPRLLHSALENILRNALRHTAEHSSIDIRLQPDGERPGFLRVDICDRGPGVPEPLLTALFEPFVRADTARSRQQGGAGLGLAIAQRAIRLHGGEVRAENRAAGGLRVIVRLPSQDPDRLTGSA